MRDVDDTRALQAPLFGAPQGATTSDDYYTPEWLFDALGLTFDVDVASPAGGLPWIPAKRFFTLEDDGLSRPWVGRVWMNPPYSSATAWVQRFMAHRNGVALLPFAKSRWFFDLWADADALVAPGPVASKFVGGQISMPVLLAAYSPECVSAIANLGFARTGPS